MAVKAETIKMVRCEVTQCPALPYLRLQARESGSSSASCWLSVPSSPPCGFCLEDSSCLVSPVCQRGCSDGDQLRGVTARGMLRYVAVHRCALNIERIWGKSDRHWCCVLKMWLCVKIETFCNPWICCVAGKPIVYPGIAIFFQNAFIFFG